MHENLSNPLYKVVESYEKMPTRRLTLSERDMELIQKAFARVLQTYSIVESSKKITGFAKY